jgi:hypothetical protein
MITASMMAMVITDASIKFGSSLMGVILSPWL